MNWNEPLFKQEDYLKEEYNAKKLKTFGVAKRSIIMSKISNACCINLFVSFGLFLALMFAPSLLSLFTDIEIEFSMEQFAFHGGIYMWLMIFFIFAFATSAFWYVIAYKRLEIMCIQLDGSLEGAVEVTEVAQRDSFINAVQKGIGVAPSNYSSIGGIIRVTERYLMQNNEKIAHRWFWDKLCLILMACQVVLAVVCLLVVVL